MEEKQKPTVWHLKYTSRVTIGVLERSRDVSKNEIKAIRGAYPDKLCFIDWLWVPWNDIVKIWEKRKPAMILIEAERAYNLIRTREIAYVDATNGALRRVVSTEPEFSEFHPPSPTPIITESSVVAASL